MDESSFETFEKPSVKEVTKYPKVALWHDHTTAHGTEEFKTCQVNNNYRSKSSTSLIKDLHQDSFFSQFSTFTNLRGVYKYKSSLPS